ncbi:MAG TPA: nucleotidyltransferase domain-containing protein [Thermoleophilaceae bacterium]|nr:nucleotidyltransferase domain-containing protein [Thermoleophilaceae bacterium]
MNLGSPHRLLAHPLDGAVVAVLSATTHPLTGREVARLAPEGSQPGISKALGRLTAEGLVDRQEAGNALLYRLNRDHLAAPAATMLADLRNALIDRLREEIAGWDLQPVHASIFGSVARGDADASSDIDLLIVRPADIAADDPRWRGQRDELSYAVKRWTGNALSTSELPEADIARLADERPPVVAAIRADAITLVGPDANRLLREKTT